MKIVAFTGGVGGAKLIDGLSILLSPQDLTVIVNTGDDFEYLSLKICPDLDTVCYTLAGLASLETGWGLQDETWITYQAIAEISGLDWFHLGDKDLGTHLVRTDRLAKGELLSEITRDFCQMWGIKHPIYPMSDQPVRTIVHTAAGEVLGFQEYFVHQACQPVVKAFEFRGIEEARPVTEALNAINACDLVVFAPSNPWVSIDPILAVPGYRSAISRKPVIAISPLIGRKAVKGPAAKMYQELGIQPTSTAVALHYHDFLTGFVIDHVDSNELEKIQRWRIIPLITDILMKDKQDRVRLAEEVLRFGKKIIKRSR